MINCNLTDYIINIDKMRNLVRYQTAPRVSSETVAEHSFFVAAYVLKLYDLFNFDLTKALSLALLHDFSEVYISDVPHPIKEDFPELSKALDEAEFAVNKKYISEEFATDIIVSFNNKLTPEGLIVNLADVLSVVSYSKYEINLGNSKYMQDVYDSVKVRYNKLIDSIFAININRTDITKEKVISYINKIAI